MFNEKQKQSLLVGGILGGAILVIVIYFAVIKIMPQIAAFDKQAADLNDKANKDEKKLKEYQAALKDENIRKGLEEQFSRIVSRLPSNQDPLQVFELLRSYFEGTDVQFSYLDPRPQTGRGRFLEYPFIIRGSARYHEFGQLVNLIECNPDRLMRVTSMKLTNNDRRPSVKNMEVGISTFTFNQQ